MQGKFLALLTGAVLAIVAYVVLTHEPPGPPVNPQLNDEAFYLLKPGMPYGSVVAVLGNPENAPATGHVVRIGKESLWHIVNYGIKRSADSRDPMFVFHGVGDESVRTLFAADAGTLIAAEYCLGDARVLYMGPSSDMMEDVMAGASLSRPSELLLQRIFAFQRKQAMRAQRLGVPQNMQIVVRGAIGPAPASDPGSQPDAHSMALVEQPSSPAAEPSSGGQPPASGPPADAPSQASVPQQPYANPFGAANPMGTDDGMRTWTSSTGTHTVAKLVGASGGVARLQKEDESLVDVPKSKLCPEDWAWIRENRRNVINPNFKTISLPSGAVLDGEGIEPRPGWQDRLLSNFSFVSYYNSGAMAVIANRKAERLEGGAASLYEDGHLQTLAEYSNNQLTGGLRIWDENKNRLLYSQYKRGKRQGITCLFDDGYPWLVQEYDQGTAGSEYYVDFKSGTARLVVKNDITCRDEKLDYADALEKLTSLDEVLSGGEKQLRKAIQDDINAAVQATRARLRYNANDRVAGRQANWMVEAATLLRSATNQ